MNPDEYDFFRHIPKEPANIALDLFLGLQDRNFGHLKKNIKARESREIFAEDALVKKKCYDEMRCEMPGQPRSTFLMVFSPDGSKVASTHGNHNIYVTDLKSGKNIKTLIGHPRTPWCIAFHPSSNQIVASGCLGGQVRIWDLSGGSEVWTAGNQSVIASIAFHPNDRILVIATYNELYFWDWSKPEPFVQIATGNPKEKVRYVAFDKLGHKLITGIANSPQTRWERVRAPVPVPRQAERSASPYRLRITPRLVNTSPERLIFSPRARLPETTTTETSESTREPLLTNVWERERRITASYRNLLREYEQLVQRYLKVYRPPVMVDRGTDPMEAPSSSTTSCTQTPIPSTSANNDYSLPSTSSLSQFLINRDESMPSTSNSTNEPQPSTSQTFSSSLVMPSKILAMKQKNKQLPETTSKHKPTADNSNNQEDDEEEEETRQQEKRIKMNETNCVGTQTQSPRRILHFDDKPSSVASTSSQDKSPGVRIVCPVTHKRRNSESPSRPGCSHSTNETTHDLTAEVRNRILPILKSLPACDRPKLIRRFENSTQSERLMRFRQIYPNLPKRKRQFIDTATTTSDSSSSDDEIPQSSTTVPNTSTTASTSTATNTTESTASISGVRNFIMELEQLLMTVLLTEIDSTEQQEQQQQESAPSTSAPNNESDWSFTNDMYSSYNRPMSNSTRAALYGRSFLRRRLPSHRLSAFMPTRINYSNRIIPMRYRRVPPTVLRSRINMEMERSINSEDDQRSSENTERSGSNDSTTEQSVPVESNTENLVERPIIDNNTERLDNSEAANDNPETSTADMLSSFSESLENIMTHSDAILRNLNGSLEMLPNQSVIETDHNYQRQDQSQLMQSLHLTITFIQNQARLLRQQLENIERIDRAMLEVEQLQLIRQLIMELLRFIRNNNENRNGISSVRQMMAGTRITDSNSYDTTSDTTATTTTTTIERPRNGRKTYPPSRLRLQQRQRRSNTMSFIHFFPRRYLARTDRGRFRGGISTNTNPTREATTARQNISNCLIINSLILDLMSRRLENLLNEQSRFFNQRNESSSRTNDFSRRTNESSRRSNDSGARSNDLGERILTLRLNDCIARMRRILNNETIFESSTTRVVTQDGYQRYNSRYTLSLIIDNITKHIEEFNGITTNLNGQINSVLSMSLLLCDLLLLQLIDSIPPPQSQSLQNGLNLDVERESLTIRIDQMCEQILQNRFSNYSQELTRSLQHTRLTMRHAYRYLGQTYTDRRNAATNRFDMTSRRQLINRFVRNMNRRRNEASNLSSMRDNLRDLIVRYSDYIRNEDNNIDNSDNDDDDEDDDESEWYVGSTTNARNTNLYRTNNVNLVTTSETTTTSTTTTTTRPWNVPSVHLNNLPIPDDMIHHRIIRHRSQQGMYDRFTGFTQMNVLRPRFLHPFYGSINPFEQELDEQRNVNNNNSNTNHNNNNNNNNNETNYDCDMITTTVTPNHRIQVWDISGGNIPVINNPLKNIIVNECKIHNDASVDVAKDGSILVTLLPSGGYLNVTNKLGVYSLKWDTLGQCLYTTSFEQNAVSVSLSPLSRHLVVGLASRRVSICPSDRWTMARIFMIDKKDTPPSNDGNKLPFIRELGQNRDIRAANYKSVNCIRWLPSSGQGLIYATNTGQLVILT